MTKKSIGTRLGQAADAVKHKVNEVADRTRAEGHDAKAETSNNPVEGVIEKGKAAVDRTKAGYHEKSADNQADKAGR